jgi:hypothetical protein
MKNVTLLRAILKGGGIFKKSDIGDTVAKNGL